ncbi:toprim domain-containing protein [Halobacillus trueperi]|uniref:toprim domain-containing protein n=1 Tax=Halobacillus trueperi TaxID=156205 RepID=UPI002162B03A|nr:toprim domain-containing protein [Halobacillus trueperi]
MDIGKPNSIHHFESPINALSYWSIKKGKLQDTRLVSMSGLKRQTMVDEIKRMGKEGLKVNQITFCTDNDNAGREFAHKYNKLFVKVKSSVYLPMQKDWNEELNMNTKNKSVSRKEINYKE